METNYKNSIRYKNAQKKVKDIKGFYVHLLVYLFVNLAILIMKSGSLFFWEGRNFWNYSTAFFWGIGLMAHWAGVFGPNIFFGKSWEERKIKELMEKDKTRTWE